MKFLLPLLAICLAAASSCAPSTPQTRIAANPALFEAQPAKHRPLIEQGELQRGMSKDAVQLAWGAPQSSFEGSRDGKTAERWDYTGSRPVHTSGFHGGYGFNRRLRHPYADFYGFGPEVIHVPYRRASVWFVSGRVDGWERLR